MADFDLYALIDPRDGEVEAYVEGRDKAKEYAHFLETSVAHPYRAYDVRFKLARVETN
jgi:hypothetical protein